MKRLLMFRDCANRAGLALGVALAALVVLPFLPGSAAFAQNQQNQNETPPAPDAPKALPGLNDPSVSGANVDLTTYVIGPADILDIEVFRDKDLSRLYPVRTDGMITVPLVGEMKAAGLTPKQLTKQLTEALTEQLKDPLVTITVYDVRSQKYEVTGQVKRPGSYPLIGTVTVFDAINDAGGFTDTFANQSHIQIIRGPTKRYEFNYKDYLKGKNTDKNIALQNGDVVYVK